jgi:hypothetical protein
MSIRRCFYCDKQFNHDYSAFCSERCRKNSWKEFSEYCDDNSLDFTLENHIKFIDFCIGQNKGVGQ